MPKMLGKLCFELGEVHSSHSRLRWLQSRWLMQKLPGGKNPESRNMSHRNPRLCCLLCRFFMPWMLTREGSVAKPVPNLNPGLHWLYADRSMPKVRYSNFRVVVRKMPLNNPWVHWQKRGWLVQRVLDREGSVGRKVCPWNHWLCPEKLGWLMLILRICQSVDQWSMPPRNSLLHVVSVRWRVRKMWQQLVPRCRRQELCSSLLRAPTSCQLLSTMS